MEYDIEKYLISLKKPKIAEHSQRFFKTAMGEYGYGDIFLGIRVPIIRKAVKKYQNVNIAVATKLLASKYHEIRLFALLLLVARFNKYQNEQQKIYNIYLNNTKYINNWDLVDSSAHHIVGSYLQNKDKNILIKLAKSDSLWERRIAVIATYYFIKNNEFEYTFNVAKLLLNDEEDLIHKAVGWMLREVGKKNLKSEKHFLEKHHKKMPKVMLRYAIEKFSKENKKLYQ